MDGAFRPALSGALRLLLALALLVLPGTPVGPALMEPLLPAMRTWLTWVEPAFAVRSLVIDRSEGRSRLRLEVGLVHPVRVAGKLVMPHPRGRARAEVPLAQAWQAPLVMTLLLLAWPARGWQEVAWRAAVALPAGAALLAMDTPLVLLAEVWQLLRLAHGDQTFSALVAWGELLRAGGRVGAGLLAAATIAMLARRLRERP